MANKEEEKDKTPSKSSAHTVGADEQSDEFGLFAEIYQLLFEQQGQHERGPWPVLFETLDELKAGAWKVLDVACGPGEPATSMACRYPQFQVVATDLSEPMVKLTQERLVKKGIVSDNKEESPRRAWAQVANAQELSDFQDNSMDLVTCFFGFIFCPDPPQALREAARVLKPGGHVICTVWERMIVSELREAMVAQVASMSPEHKEDDEDDDEDDDHDPVALGRPGLMEEWMEKEAHLIISQQKVEYFPLQLSITTTRGKQEQKTAQAKALQALSIMLSEEMKKWGPTLAEEAFAHLMETSDLLVVRKNPKEGGGDEIESIETVPNRYRMIVATKKLVDE